MLSSEGKPTDTGASGQQILSETQANQEQGRDLKQIFQLIDSFLSFEACLYHQIVPFRLEDSQLLLGMVHPQDSGALDYVSRILSYINSTMVIQEITTDTHRTILSAYLNHKNTLRSDAKQVEQTGAAFTSEKSITSIADSLIASANNSFEQNQQQTNIPISHPDSITSINPNKEDTVKPVDSSNLTILQVRVPELFSPSEVLATLPPKKLLEQLLGRVLGGGIGRLYLERQPYKARILWSDNGVLQSVLENLPLSVFQGVLNELKRFVSLPVTTLAEPKQVEKECLYQQNRLLLRLRVMPGIYGEEATLQVLRGAALKFYQQQQLTRLSRDALGISQQLSLKLRELHQRLILNPNLQSEQLQALVTLNGLVDNLEQQIKILTATNEPPTGSK
ncbi:pilus assembly protein PilB [Nostocaceae cyanobacterium CENA369]|uniref:Pilus assembly protein PilB n=1 Tax=Dendronalium phyllosphericum CENA369 TaxID=1725256 RepID=A0A8J7LDK8_9NOST|nr:pilus assembly protein PilB [Dendronalium phyllosphericum]MBH8573982.1 pilus assembly protein PilB [Dendronalium phyllosphericum CENA369]